MDIEKRTSKVLLVVIVILAIATTVLAILLVNKNKKEEKEAVSDKLSKELYDKVGGYIYCAKMEDFYVKEKITNNSILVLSLKEYIKDNKIDIDDFSDNDEYKLTIKENVMDEYVKRVFGDISYEKEDFYYSLAEITYKDNEFLLVNVPGGCELGEYVIETRLSDSYKIGNNIYIEEKVIFGDIDYQSDNPYYKYYSDYELKNYLFTESVTNNLTMDKFDNGTTMKYTFTKDKNDYIFKNVEKVN